jgi:hypothetical protein
MNKQHLDFVREALASKWSSLLEDAAINESLLPRLVKENAETLLLQLLDVILDYKKTDNEHADKYMSVMDPYSLSEMLEKHKSGIAHVCGIDAAQLAIGKIKAIVKEDKSQFNNIWIPTIEDHEQTAFPERYECQLVRFIRDMLEQSDGAGTKDIINRLLDEEHPIFKRIAIHGLNYHYGTIGAIFWERGDKLLGELLLKHELYELLKAKAQIFTTEQVERVLGWIEKAKYEVPDQMKSKPDEVAKHIAYEKRELLTALVATKNPEVIKRYEEYVKINPVEIEHPGFLTWMESGWRSDISPIEPTELCKKSNAEIAAYLKGFKGEKGWNVPSSEGLSTALTQCVLDNPEKLSLDLNPFLSIKREYQYALLKGFLEAWSKEKNFRWNNIFVFIVMLLESDAFWSEEYAAGQYHYRNWIISSIAELVTEGTKQDMHAFAPELLPQAEAILLVMANRAKSDMRFMVDIITSVLNSTLGKIYQAMINLSLRYARLYRKETESRWLESIKGYFHEKLTIQNGAPIELYVIVGEYLPNLLYLDKQWVNVNINKIFPKEKNTSWEAAFTGYLAFPKAMHKELYVLAKDNNHYSKAIETEFQDDLAVERLVQHICIAYLEGFEVLNEEDSLIFILISHKSPKQLHEIIRFMWSLRNSIKDPQKQRVKPLWSDLIQNLRPGIENAEYQVFIAELYQWLTLTDEIDQDIFEWVKLSIKYLTKRRPTFFIVEYLLKHVAKTPELVGKLYLEILENGLFPTYKKEQIIELVQILYDKGIRAIADRICNMYLNEGYGLLRETYDKNRVVNGT